MTNATKTFLAASWAGGGIGLVLVGINFDLHSLVVPGLLLMLLGFGVALHIEQVRHFAAKDEGRQSDGQDH